MLHKFSFFSGKENEQSFKIDYTETDFHSVEAFFTPEEHHTSYKGVLHGRLMAALLDDAMAYAINKEGIIAYTGKLDIRYRRPPKVNSRLHIKARVLEQKRSLYYTQGTIENEDGEICVEAKAVFMVGD